MNEQSEAPFFEALQAYATAPLVTFHMPGHQQGRGAPPELRALIGDFGLACDTTQVPGVDDIHRPEHACRAAQTLAARAYGADYSYFLVNGSTSGNHIAMLATLGAGDGVLVPRNAHSSVFGALILSGARPVFYEVPFQADMDVYGAPTLELIEAAYARDSDVRALMFASPTYYGACARVEELVAFARRHQLLVLVDEAWGPHLAFHPELPPSALAAGADLVVHSTHKLVSGLSQASLLHLRGDRVDRPRLEAVYRMLLSTSPNCLLLASLDLARRQLATQGQDLLAQTLNRSQRARAELNRLEGIVCFGPEQVGQPYDPTRLVISARGRGLSGYALETYLRQERGIQVEMSDRQNVVALVTPAHSQADLDTLVQAMAAVPRQETLALGALRPRPPFPPARLTLRDAFQADHESLPWEQAPGHICAEFISPYPPGIPVLCPGELIQAEVLDYLRQELSGGAQIQGAFAPDLATVRVVRGSTP